MLLRTECVRIYSVLFALSPYFLMLSKMALSYWRGIFHRTFRKFDWSENKLNSRKFYDTLWYFDQNLPSCISVFTRRELSASRRLVLDLQEDGACGWELRAPAAPWQLGGLQSREKTPSNRRYLSPKSLHFSQTLNNFFLHKTHYFIYTE